MSEELAGLTLAERQDLVDLLHTLDATQWSAPTPCEGWTVFDLVAHLVAWDDLLLHRRGGAPLAVARWSGAMVRARFDPDVVNLAAVRKAQSLDHHGLLRRFAGQAERRPRWLFDRLTPGAQLAEYVLHHEDVRVAIGSPRVIPEDRLRFALNGVRSLPGTPARSRLKTNRWAATDLEWCAGRGPTINAPARTVLLRLSGRDF